MFQPCLSVVGMQQNTAVPRARGAKLGGRGSASRAPASRGVTKRMEASPDLEGEGEVEGKAKSLSDEGQCWSCFSGRMHACYVTAVP